MILPFSASVAAMMVCAGDCVDDRPDLRALAAAIASRRRQWVIEDVVDPNGVHGYVVMPASADDADGPTLSLWRTRSLFRLDEFRWDEHKTLCYCATFDDAVSKIRGYAASVEETAFCLSRLPDCTRRSPPLPTPEATSELTRSMWPLPHTV